MYTRSQNVNRKSHDDISSPKKKLKLNTLKKHEYPVIPSSADDETSTKTNLELLQKEWSTTKPKGPDPETVKTLLMRTHGARRSEVLQEESTSAHSFLQKYPMLKRSTYVSQSFTVSCILFMQHAG